MLATAELDEAVRARLPHHASAEASDPPIDPIDSASKEIPIDALHLAAAGAMLEAYDHALPVEKLAPYVLALEPRERYVAAELTARAARGA